MVMVNAKKKMIASERIRIPFENDARYYSCLISRISDFIERQGIAPAKIAGIGFSLPGIVDREQRLLLRSHT